MRRNPIINQCTFQCSLQRFHQWIRAIQPLCAALFLVSAALIATTSPARAEDTPAKISSPAAKSMIDDVVAKRKSLAAEIAALTEQNGDAPADSDPADVSVKEDEREFLESQDAIYAQQLARLEQREELQNEKKLAAEELEALRKFGPTEPKPYSFLLLENLRDEQSAEEDHQEALKVDLKSAEQLLESAQNQFDEAEKERRKVTEEQSESDEPEAALANALKSAKRQSQIAKELVVLRRLELEVRTLRADVCDARKTLLDEKVDCIGKDVRFTKEDLQDRHRELAAYEVELNHKLKDARIRFQQAESQQSATLKKMQKSKAPQETIDLILEAWRVARDAQQVEMSLLSERIGDISRFHHYWTCRYESENGTVKPEEIEEWHNSLSDLVDETHDNQRSLLQRIEMTRSEQSKLVQRIRNSEDPEVKQWAEVQSEHLQRLRDACETHLVELTANERWSSRFLEELEAKLEPTTPTSWWSLAEEQFVSVWSYEIAHVDDRPITVAKIVNVIVCLLLGVLVASLLSRILGQRILPRFGLNEGASHAVASMTFYSLAILFGVLSFQLVHIPLTAFAFLGGAVAIAIGFGSQDIANNFMSGIILLAEQPIRVGDVVLFDGVQGTVTHIGPRSTRIRTVSNHELIAPNSKLLSDKVTNLTLSDNLVQTAVAVSLPLTMTVPEAKALLLQAAASHPTVLKSPGPIVLFKQFGTTAMDFELHFSLRLNDDMRAAIVQSDVRESINHLFRQVNAQPVIAAAKLFTDPLPSTTRGTKAA